MDLQWRPSLSKFARVGPGGCTEIGDGSSCRLPLYFARSLMISIDGQLTSSLLVTDHIENTRSRGPPCYCWQHKLLHPVAASFCVPFVSGKKSSDLKSASTLACKVCTMVICFWF
ncbi:hypothetical protein PVAP13_8KG140300 [Panicum virgatum]|uniref:Uncharacterized protein n=1 Tax=Panicum virgatum TaxID=38727 RepID=A0A8T0PSS8_PANVG|nr:hypothetical protein PVAP13_8KG140300 [Panicum virgatum]